METNNQQFLVTALVYLGFGENLKDNLIRGMESGQPEFELLFNGSFDAIPVSARLFFKRSLPESNYHFYKYSLQMEDKSHEFAIYKGWGITLKEGYNLLCGRAVHKKWREKDETREQSWIQFNLDKREKEGYAFYTWYDDYGYSIEQAVAQINIALPSSNWDMGMLYRSLERGNLQTVTIEKDGIATRVSICANPKDKSILVLPDIKNPDSEAHEPTDDVEDSLDKKKGKRGRLQTK